MFSNVAANIKPNGLTTIGALLLLVVAANLRAEPSLDANIFTHIEAYDSSEDTPMDDVSWGESALFLTGRLSDRWSFLSEISFQMPKYRDETVKVERLRVRYDLNRDNWFIFGKVHTPVNYWNDNFHHGRLFFPSINRPLSFQRFIPIHETGLRFAGNSLFGSALGYDVMLGTGQSNGDDVFADGVRSYTGTLSWSPDNDFKIMASYYKDTIIDHGNNPFHSHNHGGDMRPTAMAIETMDMNDMASMGMAPSSGDGIAGQDITYELISYSMFWRGESFTTLTELSMNRSSGEGGFNEAIYQYVGYHLNEDVTLYGLFDLVNVDAAEVHFAPGRESRYGFGLEYAFGLNATLKLELRRRDDQTDKLDLYSNEIQAQLSFGF